MACGTPVITSNNSSLPGVVGDAGLLVDPLDYQEIAGAIIKVISDETLHKKMIKKGKKQAHLFNWETAARQTLEVYKEAQEMNSK